MKGVKSIIKTGYYLFFLFFTLLLATSNISYSRNLDITHIKKDFALDLTPYMDFLEDKSGQLTINDMTHNKEIKKKFKPLIKKAPILV